VIRGETRIARSGRRIRRVRLVPRRPKPLPEVLEAIGAADLILVGPGSLYTSIIPNLLVAGVAEAIARSRATRVYIANLMTQPGETEGYTVADHVRAIYDHARRRLFDWVVVNRQSISPRLLRRYRAQGAEPVRADLEPLQRLGVGVIADELVEEDGVVRHNIARLTRLLLEEFILHRRTRPSR
jgi:uncharacterized cofD-like protein